MTQGNDGLSGWRLRPGSSRYRQGLLALGGAGLAILGRLLAEVPPVVEWHRTSFFPSLAPVLQSISDSSVSTWGEAGTVLFLCLGVVALIVLRTRVVGTLTCFLGLVVLAFYGSWGLAYRYPALATRLAPLQSRSDPDALAKAQLVELAEHSAQLVARAAGETFSLSGSEADFLVRINRGLFEGFARLPDSVEATPVGRVLFGRVKVSRVSFALSRLQLSGYYFPWTGEAQINAQMPRSLWPRVGAHEKAHQRGFARENDATVIGVLACLSSTDPTVFYSGALGLFVSFDRDLHREDPEARRRLWAALPQTALEALRSEAAFWKEHEGVAGKVSEAVNDTYLKAQGVTAGVLSYSETTRLFLQVLETKGLGLTAILNRQDPTPIPTP